MAATMVQSVQPAPAPKYIRVRNATLEMRRALRKRQSGAVEVDDCIIRWDTRERRVTVSDSGAASGDVKDDEIMRAIKSIVEEVQYQMA